MIIQETHKKVFKITMSQDSNIAAPIYNIVPFEQHDLSKDDAGLYAFSGYLPLLCDRLKEKYSRTELTEKQRMMLDKVKDVRQQIIDQTSELNDVIFLHNWSTERGDMSNQANHCDAIIRQLFDNIMMICDYKLPTAWCNYYDSLNE